METFLIVLTVMTLSGFAFGYSLLNHAGRLTNRWGKPDRGGSSMEIDQFVKRQNIAHYAERLKTEPDLKKRTTLENLLAEEKAKQASHDNVGK
jgi:hypothetical protein